MSEALPGQGWFVATDGQQHGPITAEAAWYFVTRCKTPVQIWHPSLPSWQSLPFERPAIAATAAPDTLQKSLKSTSFRLSNALYITWLACTISPVFVLGAALLRDLPDATVAMVIVSIVGYLGWWLYLEQSGVRVSDAELAYPFRLKLWPYPVVKIGRIRIADISGFECWSEGRFVYWFRIHAATTSSLLLLDNPLQREILAAALERRVPQAPKPAPEIEPRRRPETR